MINFPIIFFCTFAFAAGDLTNPLVFSQFLGTHDSSHERPAKFDASTWFEYPGGLEWQLNIGVRLFEFTIWDRNWVISSWHPYATSSCETLSQCFSHITRWHVQNPEHAPIFLKLQFSHDFILSDLTSLDSELPSMLPSDSLLSPTQMIQHGHGNWSTITVGNLRGKFIVLMTDFDNFLFDNHASQMWHTLNSFLICDNFIARQQFPFPDFCWFVQYDIPSSVHDDKYVGTLRAQRQGRMVLMNADHHFSQHPECTPFGTYVRCTSFDGFQTARKWGWGLALQMADTNNNGFLSLREGNALFNSLGIADDWRIRIEMEINSDLVELTYPDATNYPEIVVSHTDQEEEASLVLQSGANLLLTNWPSEIYEGQDYVFNFLEDGMEWKLSSRMKEQLWEVDPTCVDNNMEVYKFASTSRIPWVTHCDLFTLVLEEYHSVTCGDSNSEALVSFGFSGDLSDTCCDTCRRQEDEVPFEFEGCHAHDECESSDYFCASCALCNFHSVECPLCSTGVEGVCIPIENCALGVSIDNSCPDYYSEPAKCSKAQLLTCGNEKCIAAFNAYYSNELEVYMQNACECYRSADFSQHSCALDHSHHSLAQSWQWCRASSCESIIDEYICRSRRECDWKSGMVLGYCVLEGTYSPSREPSGTPSGTPSRTPSFNPGWSQIPSWNPSLTPTMSSEPTKPPSFEQPSQHPTPTSPSSQPSESPETSTPSTSPVTVSPSISPTFTFRPSSRPSQEPTNIPTPTTPTKSPETSSPTFLPSSPPIITDMPTKQPTTPRPTAPPVCDQQSLAGVLNAKPTSDCKIYRTRITRNLFVTEQDRCSCLSKWVREEAESFECLASPVETEFLVLQWVQCTAPRPTKAPSFIPPPPDEVCTQEQMYTMFVTPLYSSLCIKYTSIVLGVKAEMEESEKCECVQSFTPEFLSQMNCRPAVDERTFPEQRDACSRNPTRSPVANPTYHPLNSVPTASTSVPSRAPDTKAPTKSPESSTPTELPSLSPVTQKPSSEPTSSPSDAPTDSPTTTASPSKDPSTSSPTSTSPSIKPTSSSPSPNPTSAPSVAVVIQYYSSAVTVHITFFESRECDMVQIGEIVFFNNLEKALHWSAGSALSSNSVGTISNLFDGVSKTEWGGPLSGCSSEVSMIADGVPPSLASFSISPPENSMHTPISWNARVCDTSCKTFCFRDMRGQTTGLSLVGGMVYVAVLGLDVEEPIQIHLNEQTQEISTMGAYVFDCALFQYEEYSITTSSDQCIVSNGAGVMGSRDTFVTIVCREQSTSTSVAPSKLPTSSPEAKPHLFCSSGRSCISFLKLAYNATKHVTEESDARSLITAIRALTTSVSSFLQG